MPPMSATYSAPGNVFFAGEHATVYGTPALVAAVDMRTTATVESWSRDVVRVVSDGYGVEDRERDTLAHVLSYREGADAYETPLDPAFDLVREYDERYGLPGGVKISIESDIPPDSGGMGSSTAFLTATLAALDEEAGGKLDEPIASFCLPIQEAIHGGSASGTEFASSVHGGIHRAQPEDSGVSYDRIQAEPVPLVIGDTGRTALTEENVARVREGQEAEPAWYEQRFDAIEDIVEAAVDALREGDIARLGRLMTQNHTYLQELAVSSTQLDRMVAAVEDVAAGAKLSGGGSGGIMLALPPAGADAADIEDIADRLQTAGKRAYRTALGVEGVRDEAG